MRIKLYCLFLKLNVWVWISNRVCKHFSPETCPLCRMCVGVCWRCFTEEAAKTGRQREPRSPRGYKWKRLFLKRLTLQTLHHKFRETHASVCMQTAGMWAHHNESVWERLCVKLKLRAPSSLNMLLSVASSFPLLHVCMKAFSPSWIE